MIYTKKDDQAALTEMDRLREAPAKLPAAGQLAHKPATWDDFFAALKDVDVPSDFLGVAERNQDIIDFPKIHDTTTA
ncbi:MAG: hypothetical protein LBF16_15655 [Pseudomonadales bacterium]|nr:hypothetical protein [Pseudomonadales bacterium]